MLPLNQKMLWALTPEAVQHLKDLEAVGIDEDLAIALIEKLVPEEAIYNLEADDE